MRKVNLSLLIVNLIVAFALVSGFCYSADSDGYASRIAALEAKILNLDGRLKAVEAKASTGALKTTSGGSWGTPDGNIVDQPKSADIVSISSSGKVHFWQGCQYFNPMSETTWGQAQAMGYTKSKLCLLCVKHLVPPASNATTQGALKKQE